MSKRNTMQGLMAAAIIAGNKGKVCGPFYKLTIVQNIGQGYSVKCRLRVESAEKIARVDLKSNKVIEACNLGQGHW